MASLAFVEAKDLACVRGGRSVFRNLNFRVKAGEALALQGANGAGKTSTLRMLAGLLPQAEGDIRFGDVEDAEERGHMVAWLGHQDGIKAQLSVAENAAFFARIFGASGAADALGRVGLAAQADWPVNFLSAGQRRRLALARLLLSHRPLWLLDEPNAALDEQGRALMTSLIKEHLADAGIAIIATHEAPQIPCARLTLP